MEVSPPGPVVGARAPVVGVFAKVETG